MAGKMVRFRKRRRTKHNEYTSQRERTRTGYAPSKWSSPITLCPDSMFVRLKYAETLTFGTVGVSDNIFRGNCHIDPSVSALGVGFSAYGAGNWSSFYSRCHCTSSTIRIKCLADQQVLISVYPSNQFTPSLSPELAAQRPRKRTTIVGPFSDVKTLARHATTKAIIGERRTSAMNYASSTTIAQFPLADWYWHIVTEQLGVPANVTLLVELDYTVTFFDRRQVLLPISAGPAEPPV